MCNMVIYDFKSSPVLCATALFFLHELWVKENLGPYRNHMHVRDNVYVFFVNVLHLSHDSMVKYQCVMGLIEVISVLNNF